MTPRRSARRRAVAQVIGCCAVALVLAACASVPTAGPVRIGDPIAVTERPNAPVALVSPPADGASPEEIVTGFLTANAVPTDDYAIARTFLSPEVQETWNPSAGAVVYSDGPGFSLTGSAGGEVVLEATELGRLGADSTYLVTNPGTQVRQSFVLRQISGQWRILELRDGLFLTQRDLTRVYDGYDVYFLDPTGSVLVPDRVLVVRDRPGLGTTLVRRLLEGPSTWLAPAVVSAFPEGTQLAIDATPVEDGVMTVELDDTVLQADDEGREQLAAQLVWTLTALPGVDAVQLRVSGQALSIGSLGTVLVRNSFTGFDPDAIGDGAQAFLIDAGRLTTIPADGSEGAPVPGVFGEGAVEPILAAVNLSASQAGAEVEGPALVGRVFVAAISDGSTPVQRLQVGGVGSLSYDRLGNLFVVDSTDGAIRLLPPSGAAEGVAIPDSGRVLQVALSRDGTRAAVVVRNADPGNDTVLLTRVVRRPGAVRFEAPRRIENELSGVIDVAWADADRLVVVATADNRTRQVYDVVVGGTSVVRRGGVRGISAVAAAPGSPVLVEAEGGVWENAGSGWRRVGPGTNPVYPG